MHASLDLLAGVVAAAANESAPATAHPPTSAQSNQPISTHASTNRPHPPPPTSTAAPDPSPSPLTLAPPYSAPPSHTAIPPQPLVPAALNPPNTNAPHPPNPGPRPPSPMFSAPIPHLSPSPPSPPSDVTTSTATVRARARDSNPPASKRAKSRNSSTAAPRRPNKRNFEAASDTPSSDPASKDKSHSKHDDDSADNKRAMRAERNRQSAAASRERKKRHIKELEDKVKYLTDVNANLQYRMDVQKKASEDKEMVLSQQIAQLQHQLSRESAFRNPPPQNHPMTLHHLTHRGPVTY